MVYNHTHVHKDDGSPAMLICPIGKSHDYPNHAIYQNENGDKWTAPREDWLPINDR